MYTLLIFGIAMQCAVAVVQNDEVKNLPGLAFTPSFKHYSGYLVSNKNKMLHYWFVESQNEPANDPVVLWLNGGPGCSSMDGMLTEHGPFRVSDDGKTINNNPWSWNKIVNMLYIEAPAGVGYSYSSDRNYTINDDEVAADNHAALRYFFKMFPEYAQNELYLTGESYAGIYIPTLANVVMQDSSLNLKGIAVGNGMSDYPLNDKSLMYFGYFHGLWGKTLERKLITNCCKNGNLTDCEFDRTASPQCLEATQEAGGIIGSLNVYNMYSKCYKGPQYNNKLRFPTTAVMLSGSRFFQHQTLKFYAAERNQDVELSPPCVDGRGITTYMNNVDVKKALHIADNLPEWSLCSDVVGMHYVRVYNTMTSQYRKLLSSGKYRVLVYNGDVDMACNFLMDEWFVDSLGAEVVDDYRAWMYTDVDQSSQIGGYAKHYRNLVFATVRGAGHMVPTDRPVSAFAMFQAFIKGQML